MQFARKPPASPPTTLYWKFKTYKFPSREEVALVCLQILPARVGWGLLRLLMLVCPTLQWRPSGASLQCKYGYATEVPRFTRHCPGHVIEIDCAAFYADLAISLKILLIRWCFRYQRRNQRNGSHRPRPAGHSGEKDPARVRTSVELINKVKKIGPAPLLILHGRRPNIWVLHGGKCL